MTPFDVLVEELKRKARKWFKVEVAIYLMPHIEPKAYKREIDTLITHTAHAVREATLKEVEAVVPSETVTSKEESFRRSDKATEWGYNVCRRDILAHLATLSTKDTPTT